MVQDVTRSTFLRDHVIIKVLKLTDIRDISHIVDPTDSSSLTTYNNKCQVLFLTM